METKVGDLLFCINDNTIVEVADFEPRNSWTIVGRLRA